MSEGWLVTIVHGSDDEECAEETLGDLFAAMEWARLKGAEYHLNGVDCLGLMHEKFVKEDPEGTWFQYGTNYHWVTFEKVS